MLKRFTSDLIRGIRYDPDLHPTKFRVRLYQWLEGEEPDTKLPKMRDLVDSDRDFVDG